MALTKTTYVERVLIVLNEDGTFKAAHKESLDIVRDGDTVLSSTLAPAAPLAEADLAGVLPDVAALTAQLEAANVALAAANTALTAMTTERDQLAAQLPARVADPAVVTMRQARLALHNAGILPAVETCMATAPKPVQIEWEFADTVPRSSELVTSIGAQLGLTSEQIDALFVAAKAL